MGNSAIMKIKTIGGDLGSCKGGEWSLPPIPFRVTLKMLVYLNNPRLKLLRGIMRALILPSPNSIYTSTSSASLFN